MQPSPSQRSIANPNSPPPCAFALVGGSEHAKAVLVTSLPPHRRWLILPLGLLSGTAIGMLLPTGNDTPAIENNAAHTSPDSQGGDAESLSTAQKNAGIAMRSVELFPGSRNYESLSKLPPEKLVAIFERLSNLKSDSRKYSLAYRLASQMEAGQIEAALEAALKDLSDGDYVTTRAIARRWAEIDPKAAAAKAIESKQVHLIWPVLESWSRMDPKAPLQWALQQDPAHQADALRPLLTGRLLDENQLEKLVVQAADSSSEEMRHQIFPYATGRLAEVNPSGALHVASHIDENATRQKTLSMVMSKVAQRSPEVGRAWLESQQNLPPQERAIYLKMLGMPIPANLLPAPQPPTPPKQLENDGANPTVDPQASPAVAP